MDSSVSTIDDLLLRFEQLNEIGAALSSERDINRLLEKILIAAKQITNADGGTLYLLDEDGTHLKFEILHSNSLNITMGGTSGNPIPFQPLPLAQPDGSPNESMVAVYCALHKCTINISDAYAAENFDFSGTRSFDSRTGYRSKSFLTVPMKNHESELIGVLQLINALDQNMGDVIAFSSESQRLVESLASQASIAVSNRQLTLQQEKLFESFIDMINFAIDDKSAYTGGHCQRVPTLTMMLAEAVANAEDGPFASFRMTDQDRYELKIAGLLHDCGKITTPVHIVDKATKLETIYDRIDLVDTRFEVLKRDAEIAMLKARLALRIPTDPLTERSLESGFKQQLDALEQDRAFLQHANTGSETMEEKDRQAVRDIGTKRKWTNPNGDTVDFLTANEMDNLTIRSGTLGKAERDIINHHIVVTIKMLESLPWVKHLKRVPEYAGGHHERMDGKGYPRGLTRDEMSVQARIMGIADIFEALTASDRPYKPGKTLSESLQIMKKFRINGHIDPDLFDIFVQSKVYLRYAHQFLSPEQIDMVNEASILQSAA
ncbi:MAG: phosphohydrolase [Burkholderiales bacterium RIFCSPLOWO2_02_FULL_57_36]|nr:MAG: phosphohydrolase [Burkholderiales bacterium RIFCSPLOWO2_02_FULL_57_36]